jgi:C1A family cysteine protease
MHKKKDYGAMPRARGLMRRHQEHQLFLACTPRRLRSEQPLPGEWDLRKRVAPSGNQLTCGSCWAFSITGALRSYAMLKGTDPGPLSPNYLLLNAGPVPGNGCGGGDFDAGKNCIDGRGPCVETLSPYIGTVDGLTYPVLAPVAASAGRWVALGCGRPAERDLCEALYNGGVGAVICADIAAQVLDDYESGIITRTTAMQPNHMVRLVGFNAGASVDRNGNAVFTPEGHWADPRGAHFILRNSWGQEWGLEGDCLIAYGVNNLAETAMMFAE